MSGTIAPQEQSTSHAPGDGSPAAFWASSAPKSLSRRNGPPLSGKAWDEWAAHLAKRKRPAGLPALLPGKIWPLEWALPDALADHFVHGLSGQLPRLGRRARAASPLLGDELRAWMRESADTVPSAALGLDALSVAHALPCLTGMIPAELWWDLLTHLVNVAKDPAALDLRAEPLAIQFLAGELPLTLAFLFPELRQCHELLHTAGENLSAGLLELLDGEGLPHGHHLDLLRPLLACWTRCQAMAADLKKSCFTDDAHTQYRWLVLNALRLTRHDGRQMLAVGGAGECQPELLDFALCLGGDAKDHLAAGLTLKGQTSAKDAKKSRSQKRLTPRRLPQPSNNSEWSGVALLRADWLRTSPRLLVNYADRQVKIELAAGPDVLFSGTWALAIEIDGQPLEPIDEWETTCWNSDEEGEYLELEISCEGGVRVQRQFVLSRQDRVFYLADVVLGVGNAKIDYRGTLPLTPNIQFEAARETRECYLAVHGRKQAVILPLALPEWRVDPRSGALTGDDSVVELRQHWQGTNLYCPLFIDLDRRRFSKQLTWRQLTVAQGLKPVSADAAVGFRAQTGKEQWLFYRSLSERGNRTLLAQNLSSEFLAARFKSNGDIEEIIEVE